MPAKEGEEQKPGDSSENQGFWHNLSSRAVRSTRIYKQDIGGLRDTHSEIVASLRKRIEGLENELESSAQEGEELLEIRGRLEARVKRLEDEPTRMLGLHILESSNSGVLVVNKDFDVVEANSRACEYLGMELPEIVGQRASSLAPQDANFTRYVSMFEQYAVDFALHGKRFEPNTFDIREVPMTLMVYPTVRGEGVNAEYTGGFIVMTPHVTSPTLLRKFTERMKHTIPVEGGVNQEKVLGYIVELMNTGRRAVYVDFKKVELVETSALDAFARCYEELGNQDAQCVFGNVPLDISQYLARKGVSPRHIRQIKRREKCIASPMDVDAYIRRMETSNKRRRFSRGLRIIPESGR